MGKTTNIAWTESTLNLAWGCTKVSEECRNCYMYRMSPALGRDPFTVNLTKAGMDIGATGERAIQAMGDGSKSDDIDRHKFLIAHGIIPVYIENHDIDHAPHLVVREIRMKLKLLRLVAA